MTGGQPAPYIFISYASADRARVLPLVDALMRAGIGVWIDREGIHGGANYGEEIAEAIKGSVALVLMTSATSLASRNVKQEIALAWDFERPYVPLLLEPVTIPTDVRYWLTTAQWVEVLDKAEVAWLPQVLTALAPLGIAPVAPQQAVVQLAGRERELALLHEKLTATKAGKGSLILIGGEAGIGKTTLAEAALRDAAGQGFAVLEGHCFDLAETPPYGPWIDLFARFAPVTSSPTLPDAFAVRGTVGAVPNQMALFVQVQDFLAALGTQRPVAMLLDDLHWSDPASLDLLRFLARSVADLPLLVLVTYRSDELTRRHPLYALLPQLAREASAARLDLGRLDDTAARALVDDRYGLPDVDAARLVVSLQARAEGNALFIGELLRSLEEGGVLGHDGDAWRLGDLAQAALPALLRQVIDGRLGRLDEDARRLLAVAAVIGHEIPLDVWAATAESDEDALLAVIEQGLEARLLVEAGGEVVRFAHALIRETLYEGIPGIRRRRLHRTVGEALAETTSPDPDAVAYHFQQADDTRALPWLLKAGERAQAAYGWLTAAARFEAALALMDRSDADAAERGWLLMHLASLLRYADLPKARAFAEEALAVGERTGERPLIAYARYQSGILACFAGDVTRGQPEVEAAIGVRATLSGSEQERFVARVSALAAGVTGDWRANMVFWLAYQGRLREAQAEGEYLLTEMAVGSDHEFYGLGLTYAALGRPEAATADIARARDTLLRGGHHAQVTATLVVELNWVALPYRTEDLAGRAQLTAQAEEEEGRARGAMPASVEWPVWRLPLLVLAGQWEEAERFALPPSTNEGAHTHRRSSALQYLAVLAWLRGDAERAWWAVRQGLPGGNTTEPGTMANFGVALALQRVAVALSLDDEEMAQAKQWLEAHDRWLDWTGSVLWRSEGQTLWARYYRQSGDMEQARTHAERALAHATEPRQPLALIAAHRLLGELETDAGRYDEAGKHLNASLSIATACEAPYERALTLLAMAELRAATGDKDDARTLLAEVQAICEPLGAKPALARAAALAASL